MSFVVSLRNIPSASPWLALAGYAAVVLLLLAIIIGSIADVLAKRSELAAATGMRDELAGRRPAAVSGVTGTVSYPSGSPYLEGATVTVAGAGLLQRVAAAVARRGGNVLSSQVDLNGTQAKAGFISVVASCEIGQSGLQELLYDLEAGMPFLFVDQLSVQAPASFASAGDGKLRVLLNISGQWQGSR